MRTVLMISTPEDYDENNYSIYPKALIMVLDIVGNQYVLIAFQNKSVLDLQIKILII